MGRWGKRRKKTEEEHDNEAADLLCRLRSRAAYERSQVAIHPFGSAIQRCTSDSRQRTA